MRCPRPTRCSASTTTPTSPLGYASSRRASRIRHTGRATAGRCSRWRRSSVPVPVRPRFPATPRRRPTCRTGSRRPPAHALYDAGSAPARWLRSSSRPAATGGARSARSPVSRGSFVSRPPAEVLQEARWLADHGVRELFLVSENSTSYGKDLGDLRRWRRCCPSSPRSRALRGCACRTCSRPRCGPAWSTRSPARQVSRPTSTCLSSTRRRPCCVRMRRFGDAERFLGLLDRHPCRGADGRGPEQRHRRLPGRDRAGRRSAERVPYRGAARRRRRVRLLRRGRHRGGPPARQAERRRDLATGSITSRAWSRSWWPSAPRTAWVSGSRFCSSPSSGSTGGGRSEAQGPEVDGTTEVRGLDVGATQGDVIAADVTGSRGVDLSRPSWAAEADHRAARIRLVPDADATPSAWNLPNALTTLRVLLVPVFGWLLLVEGGNDPAMRIWAALVFGVAIVTDRFDGAIARRRNSRDELRQDHRPDRRQGADRHGVRRPVARSASSGGGSRSSCWPARSLVTVLRFWVIRLRRHGRQPRRAS